MPVSSRASSRLRTVVVAATAVATLLVALTACAPASDPVSSDVDRADVVRVPEDAATISDAMDAVADGGLVLVGPGTYVEQVLIDVPDVTLRGVDRNTTIIDGEGTRPYGVVAIADGVRIENLTVTRATFYGVLVTGLHDESGPTAHGVDGYSRLDPEQFPPVERFAIDHVTAHNNGLYGLYAFNSRHGVIRDSYASGSADSGIYVGQCEQCDILVTGNVAEHNAVGFENANASDSVVVVGNRFSNNRIGMTFLSNYQEAFSPQRGNVVAGNAVLDNAEADSPAHADGGFGIGIGISGGTRNVFERNLIAGNPRAGVLLDSTEDLASLDNRSIDDVFAGNGVDVANVSGPRAAASGNCGFAATTMLPPDLLAGCGTDAAQPSVAVAELPGAPAPAGVSFLRVAGPPPQPGLAAIDAPPARLPDAVDVPEAAEFALATPDLLRDRARS